MAPTVIAARSGAAPAGGRSFLVGIIDPDALHSDMTARSGELLEPSMPTESSAHRTRPPGTSIPRILALSLGGIFPGILKSPRTPLC